MITSSPSPTPCQLAPQKYIHGHHASVLRSHSWRTVENSAAYLIPYLTPGCSVLDVGSGAATITVDIAERVAPGRVVGLDAAASVIDGSNARHADVSQLSFIVGDAFALPFADDSFDVVHAHQVLQHLPDPVAALLEFRRVVRPGGVVGVRDVDYIAAVWYPELPGLDKWRVLYQRTARANAGEPNAGRRLKAWARAAGFTDIEATGSLWAFTNDVDRQWWGGSWAERVLESEFAASALRHGLATQAELQEIADAWLQWTADPDATFMLPHGEVLARA